MNSVKVFEFIRLHVEPQFQEIRKGLTIFIMSKYLLMKKVKGEFIR
jgi:hypothetical protein